MIEVEVWFQGNQNEEDVYDVLLLPDGATEEDVQKAVDEWQQQRTRYKVCIPNQIDQISALCYEPCFRNAKDSIDVGCLQGKTIAHIEVIGGKEENDCRDTQAIVFLCTDGTGYIMFHPRAATYSVDFDLESITGDLMGLIGKTIVLAEKRLSEQQLNFFDGPHPVGTFMSQEEYKNRNHGSRRWVYTYYTLAAVGGYVDIRWYGESNGYYSEAVEFMKLTDQRARALGIAFRNPPEQYIGVSLWN